MSQDSKKTPSHEDDWSERDNIPTSDPIGDIVDGEGDFESDMRQYLESMKKNVLNTQNKNFNPKSTPHYNNITNRNIKVPPPIPHIDITFKIPDILKDNAKKCDCGTTKVYKNPTLKMHSHWCELRKYNNIKQV